MIRTGVVWILAGMIGVCVLGAQQPTLKFDVVSVKPEIEPVSSNAGFSGLARVRPGGVLEARHIPLSSLLTFAFNLPPFQITGGPDWVRRDLFQVDARASSEVPIEQMRHMMQSMLEDRFKLATHREQRQMPVEVLILARSDGRLGPNVQSIDECTAEKIAKVRQLLPPRPKRTPRGTTSSGCTVGFGDLATGLTQILATPVIDGTGLTGRHFFEVHAEAPRNQAGAQSEADPGFPPWRMALEEQLGLKLESRRGPMEVLVVDSVQQPTEN